MDLIVYFSPMEGRFTYYINNSSTGFKIEYPVTAIRRIKFEHLIRKVQSEVAGVPPRDDTKHRARIMIELIHPPLFYSELRGGGGWHICQDFTQGMVASTIFLHTLVGSYESLHKEFTELASMSPDLNARLWMDEEPLFLSVDEDEHSAVTSSDRSRRHSSATAMPAPPSRPASAIPVQFARQHLTPVPVFAPGAPRTARPSFQAHRRTRSRSLPTAINVSDLALAGSQNLATQMVPGMQFAGTPEMPQFVTLQAPLRIDTSVADSTIDYYRQFTPSSNLSSQITPVDYSCSSPASQLPLPSSLPFYDGPVNGTYSHAGIYPTDSMDTSAMYADDVAVINLNQFQPTEAYTYTANSTLTDTFTSIADQQAWSTATTGPQVTVTTSAAMEVEEKDLEIIKDPEDSKMEVVE